MTRRVFGNVTVLVLALSASAAFAAGIGPKRSSDLIMLKSVSGGCGGGGGISYFDTRVQSDGTLVPFSIPTGSVLVVKEVEFLMGGGQTGERAEMVLYIGDDSSATEIVRRREALVAKGSDYTGTAQVDFSFGDGLVISPGKSLCFLEPGSPVVTNSSLHGYLMKDTSRALPVR